MLPFAAELGTGARYCSLSSFGPVVIKSIPYATVLSNVPLPSVCVVLNEADGILVPPGTVLYTAL